MRRMISILWGLAVVWAVTLAPLQAGLIAFYPFEGNANDATGHGYNGTEWFVIPTASGYQGQAFIFDGGGYVTSPVNINPGVMPQLTMGAWARAEVNTGIRAVISHDDGGFDRNLNMDTRVCSYDQSCWSAFTGWGVMSVTPVTTGQWVFLAVRYDAAGGWVVLDVDTNRGSTNTAYPGPGFDTTRIGSNPGFGEYFVGIIDNVFIYDEFLSDAQIDAIRLGGADAILPQGVPEPGTIGLLALGIGMLLAFRLRR
jgi:hypothetical protein